MPIICDVVPTFAYIFDRLSMYGGVCSGPCVEPVLAPGTVPIDRRCRCVEQGEAGSGAAVPSVSRRLLDRRASHIDLCRRWRVTAAQNYVFFIAGVGKAVCSRYLPVSVDFGGYKSLSSSLEDFIN